MRLRAVSLALLVALAGLALLAPLACREADGPPTLVVAAAADLQFVMDELVEEFRARHPDVRVRVTYGSSGNFYAQLVNRAPFDLYFSADAEYPRGLAARGLALDGDVFLYAIGRVVLWSPRASGIDVEQLGLEALRHPRARKIAIANPEHAPYGVAAVQSLRALGLYEEVQDRLVLGENVAQTAQFVQSGAADVGVIALALALAPVLRDVGGYFELPLESFARMDQGGMIAAWTRAPEAARAFKDHVLGAEGRARLAAYGFFLPE